MASLEVNHALAAATDSINETNCRDTVSHITSTTIFSPADYGCSKSPATRLDVLLLRLAGLSEHVGNGSSPLLKATPLPLFLLLRLQYLIPALNFLIRMEKTVVILNQLNRLNQRLKHVDRRKLVHCNRLQLLAVK